MVKSHRLPLLLLSLSLSLSLLPPLSGMVVNAHAEGVRRPDGKSDVETVDRAALGTDRARMLLTRAGFAPRETEVADYAHMTRERAVERLLNGTSSHAQMPPPDWVDEATIRPGKLKDLSDAERKAYQDLQVERGFALRGWWLREMLTTSSPLTERMTLFWHNHFVSSQQKVRAPQLMYRQNVLLRENALGNFGRLLHAVGKDPAMVIYLDSATNRKGSPNENFAREVMELFTLGEGNYSEQDVKEAARAFTGWSIDPDSGAFLFRPLLHDDGAKTVLGRNGNFDGDAVLDILLQQPATAEFVVRKLWREFISPTPDAAEVSRIARQFRDSNDDIKTALRGILMSPQLLADANRGTLIKSPVDLVVGTIRQFDFHWDDPLPFTFAVAQLGQNLFAPPNVKGWPGGEDWINSQTLLARKQVLERLFRAIETSKQAVDKPLMMAAAGSPDEMGKYEMRKNEIGKVQGAARIGRVQFDRAAAAISFDPEAWLAQYGAHADRTPDVTRRLAIQQALMPVDPTAPVPEVTGVSLLRTLVMDPAYELK